MSKRDFMTKEEYEKHKDGYELPPEQNVYSVEEINRSKQDRLPRFYRQVERRYKGYTIAIVMLIIGFWLFVKGSNPSLKSAKIDDVRYSLSYSYFPKSDKLTFVLELKNTTTDRKKINGLDSFVLYTKNENKPQNKQILFSKTVDVKQPLILESEEQKSLTTEVNFSKLKYFTQFGTKFSVEDEDGKEVKKHLFWEYSKRWIISTKRFNHTAFKMGGMLFSLDYKYIKEKEELEISIEIKNITRETREVKLLSDIKFYTAKVISETEVDDKEVLEIVKPQAKLVFEEKNQNIVYSTNIKTELIKDINLFGVQFTIETESFGEMKRKRVNLYKNNTIDEIIEFYYGEMPEKG